MSSSSSATAADSRSTSPVTPEAFDSLDPIAIHSDIDLSNSWYLPSMQHHKPLGEHTGWEMNTSEFITPRKPEDDPMLHLDELIEQHAYDDSPASTFGSPGIYNSPTHKPEHVNSSHPSVDRIVPNFRPGNLLIPSRNGPMSVTKPVPPPASLPRKQDPSSMNQRVVHPPKESCYNLPIMVPSIPEGGTKSRVETQVRVTVDLADASSSSDPYKYDRVGSWKWLKLPQGTATKKRTRKQGKIDPDPQDILHLSATVSCASPPHNRVLSCSSCQTREAKRVAKKLAARVRPARSDTESGDDPSSTRHSKSKQTEDTTSIIQFNCAEVLDFSTGSVVLPLRITCYCRHHREKVGFNVHFTMIDHLGRIVGTGSSRPIMITDDHKTAPSNTARQMELNNGFRNMETDWPPAAGAELSSPDCRAPSKRRPDASNKRPKPYDSSGKPNRLSRESSVASVPSPPSTFVSLPTRSSTPSAVMQQIYTESMTPQPPPQLQYSSNGSEMSSPDSLVTPLDLSPDINLPDPNRQQDMVHTPSPLSLHTAVPSVVMPSHPHPMPFMFFDPNQAQQGMTMQLPIIHRLIPNMGPTHGGIEVTILGANFHPSLQLNCIFGDVTASSTQRWSDNTLVCVLPPRATAGVVAVWFDGFPKMVDQSTTPPSLFTYTDESDRALMELALQVVGLKMTGKIEDAKNVAMRIVGGSENESQTGGNNSNMMQLASSVSTTRDLRPLLLSRAGDTEHFESSLVDFLKVLDIPLDHEALGSIETRQAISHVTCSGQTLLHLATFLGFSSLATFLVNRGIDLDARDRNGYTALHFAALSNSEACVRVLLDAGADREIVNALGKTPGECSQDMVELFDDAITENDSDSDEEAQWGDAEEEPEPIRRTPTKRASRRNLRRGVTSGKATPVLTRSVDISRASTPPPSSPPDVKTAKGADGDGVDAKQTASFIEMIQRTLAQFPATQGIIPNIAQLPIPHLPHLPGMPALPWGVLPQIPMVFPVYVPMMPSWPAFLSGEHPGQEVNKDEGTEGKGVGAGAIRTAQELRATWEKWFALAIATAKQEEMPPPVYTPREDNQEKPSVPEGVITVEAPEGEASTSEAGRHSSTADLRPVGYSMAPVPDQEVKAYGYRPSKKQAQKLQKKHDKMLLIFWLPILFMSMLWAIHSGIQFTFQLLKTALPAKTPFVH